MMHALRQTMNSLRSSPMFALFVLMSLVYAGLIGVMVGVMAFGFNFLLPGPFAQMTHFSEEAHRVHDLTFGFIFLPAIVGVLAQLRHPAKNVAGMLMALIPWIGLLLAALLSDAYLEVILFNPSRLAAVLTFFTALLHPTGRDFFRSFRMPRVNWMMFGFVVVAAVPLIALATTNIGLQRSVADEHAGMGHYGFMAAIGFTVIGMGVLASLRADGWRLPAWVAGVLPVLFGLTSLIYPDAASSLGALWALAAIVWGVAFITTAELTKEAELPTLLGLRAAVSRSERA